MADIKLGLLGTEVTLPVVNEMLGTPPPLPEGYRKQVDMETMLDGSTRGNVKAFSPRTFSLPWARLPIADVTTLIGLAEKNVRLHYQNAWHSATWRWVMVADLQVTPVVYIGTVFYRVTLELLEVGP